MNWKIRGVAVDIRNEIKRLLDDILHLGGRSAAFSDETVLMGAIPELDSMAVVALIAGLEDRFGFVIHDEEIDGSIFATLGDLNEFVAGKISASV